MHRFFVFVRRPAALKIGEARHDDGLLIGKFRNERQSPTHSFNVLSERREEEVGSFFKPRDSVLPDPQNSPYLLLRQPVSFPKLA